MLDIRNAYRNVVGNPEGGVHLGDLSVVERIILKLFLN
jgi:hypothetical protein